jgi:hypothetical protein
MCVAPGATAGLPCSALLHHRRRHQLPRRIAQPRFMSTGTAAGFLVSRAMPRIAADEAVYSFDRRAE